MSSADECNLRCAQEERCLFTSFVKMTNGGKEICYLFEHGALVLFNKVKGNGDNIKEGKVSIFSSKLKGTSGIEAIGLQVGFFFKSIKEVLGEKDHSSTPKDEGQHTCTVLLCCSRAGRFHTEGRLQLADSTRWGNSGWFCFLQITRKYSVGKTSQK